MKEFLKRDVEAGDDLLQIDERDVPFAGLHFGKI